MAETEAVRLAQLVIRVRNGTRTCTRCADIEQAFDDDEHQRDFTKLVKLAEEVLDRVAHAPN